MKRTGSGDSTNSLKKVKPSVFEEELERLNNASDQVTLGEESWERPAIHLDSKLPLVFQQIDVEDYYGSSPAIFPNPYGVKEQSLIRIFGVTESGNSVMCHVHGFYPYLYVQAPTGFNQAHIRPYIASLNSVLSSRIPKGKSFGGESVLDVELTNKSSIYGYQGESKFLFLKIKVRLQSIIATCKRVFKEGFHVPGLGNVSCFQTFESNIPLALRYMIDSKMQGATWIELAASKYFIREINQESTCQIEVDISYENLTAHQPDGEWSKIAPLRILSFDIECAGRKGVFPDATIDPVIQIANIITLQGETKPCIQNVFTLNTCSHIVGTQTLCFEKESDLLLKWSEFIRKSDPDIIIGYNINGFDFPYLLDRAKALKLDKFPFLGRIGLSRTVAKDSQFSSKAFGTRNNKVMNIEGRIQMDVLTIMQRDHKLRSYTLNSVSAHFLGEQKEDVHHSIITDLQNGNDETRRRLAIYCLKDAYLPQRLIDKLMCVINYIEMARVTGVNFNYLLTRGQQIKVVSQLFRQALTEDLLIPAMEIEGTDEQYEGATVIEPEKGFYEVPIATLDFASLYPSIMMAHNLCYSTWLQDKAHAARFGLVQDVDYKVTPNNDLFLVQSKRKGLLPTILEDLLTARKKAKADLKKETDPFKRAVLDGRQLALKISANSVYGFTGATIGKLPLLAISSSVTSFGRVMIERTKQLTEERFTIANGYKYDAKVIYGDTDSVMVKFGVDSVADAMKLGQEAADFVTQDFQRPIKLEFEKVYYPYLLINKKRYAGLYWTRPTIHDKMDAKGIETVRRDSCRLVSTVIETSLRKLLIDRDVTGACDYVKGIISDLLQNKVDLSQLVISKALGKAEYAGKQAHSELADRMRKRDAGSAPALGDRVSYVIIKGAKDAAAYEKAEDPIYVLENNLPIDTKYYLENQLSKPLMRIFEPVLGDKASSLLSGNHTRTVSIAARSTGGLMKFAVKIATCLGCKAPLKRNPTEAVCESCTSRLPELYSKNVIKYDQLSMKFSKLWTQCQRCQGSLHQEVLCTSQDCPIFYMRKKVQKDLGDAHLILDRFDFEW
ncbi:DNA polymerase family B-domain-containing protein [Globomyces pollinis-pini]|nr:DNA polymerase family B-domain-containing protein [Globomyces pollinis-pini]